MANWCALASILNTTFSLITFVSNNLSSWKFTGVYFLTQEIQKWQIFGNSLKPTDFELWENPIKIYYSVYIYKIKRCGTIDE